MNITRARITASLSANAGYTGTNVTGSAAIGEDSVSDLSATVGPIAYAFKVTSTGVGDVAVVDLQTGVVSAGLGTPTITDGDGNDFEGVTLPTASKVLAIKATTPATNSGFVYVTTPEDFGHNRDVSMKLHPGKFGVVATDIDPVALSLEVILDVAGLEVEVVIFAEE